MIRLAERCSFPCQNFILGIAYAKGEGVSGGQSDGECFRLRCALPPSDKLCGEIWSAYDLRARPFGDPPHLGSDCKSVVTPSGPLLVKADAVRRRAKVRFVPFSGRLALRCWRSAKCH